MSGSLPPIGGPGSSGPIVPLSSGDGSASPGISSLSLRPASLPSLEITPATTPSSPADAARSIQLKAREGSNQVEEKSKMGGFLGYIKKGFNVTAGVVDSTVTGTAVVTGATLLGVSAIAAGATGFAVGVASGVLHSVVHPVRVFNQIIDGRTDELVKEFREGFGEIAEEWALDMGAIFVLTGSALMIEPMLYSDTKPVVEGAAKKIMKKLKEKTNNPNFDVKYGIDANQLKMILALVSGEAGSLSVDLGKVGFEGVSLGDADLKAILSKEEYEFLSSKKKKGAFELTHNVLNLDPTPLVENSMVIEKPAQLGGAIGVAPVFLADAAVGAVGGLVLATGDGLAMAYSKMVGKKENKKEEEEERKIKLQARTPQNPAEADALLKAAQRKIMLEERAKKVDDS